MAHNREPYQNIHYLNIIQKYIGNLMFFFFFN